MLGDIPPVHEEMEKVADRLQLEDRRRNAQRAEVARVSWQQPAMVSLRRSALPDLTQS